MCLPMGDPVFEDSTRNQIGLITDRVSLLNQKMPKTTQRPWPSEVGLACFHPFCLSSFYRLPWTNIQSNTFESLSSHSLTLHVALVLSILPRNPHHLPGHNKWDINEHVGGVIICGLFPVLGLITPLASQRQTKNPVTSNARALRTSTSNESKAPSTQNTASQTPRCLKSDQHLEMSQVTFKQPKLSV